MSSAATSLIMFTYTLTSVPLFKVPFTWKVPTWLIWDWEMVSHSTGSSAVVWSE